MKRTLGNLCNQDPERYALVAKKIELGEDSNWDLRIRGVFEGPEAYLVRLSQSNFGFFASFQVCCLLMFAFILKFFLQDIFYEERDRNSTDRILNQVPQVSMSRVQLPVHFVDVTSEPGSNPDNS